MKVLFVSMVAFEDNSSATIQNKGIIKGLSAIHDVDVMTLRPNQRAIHYDDSMNDINKVIKNYYYIDIDPKYAVFRAKKQKYIGEEHTHGKTKLLKSVLNRGRNVVKALYDNTSIFDAQKINVKGISKLRVDYGIYDIIITASDPKSSHLIGEKIFRDNKECKAKWIQYWGDPMLHDISRKSGWRDILVKYHENRLISKADKIIYASPLTLEKQMETFPKSSLKMSYANQVYAHVKNQSYNVNKETKDYIKVGYFGNYNSKIRNIMPLYNAAKDGDFSLKICGSSDLSLRSTENISVNGMAPYKEAMKMEKESDILVCICNSKGTQIPGKIYYCTSYMKPILVIVDSEYKDQLRVFLESFERFILCENNVDSIKDAIKKAKAQLIVNEFKLSDQLTPEYMADKILANM